jgi:hypothetical protein
MQYFRYRAYNKEGQLSEGVTHGKSWEYAALSLIQIGLTPSNIERIDYGEYKRFSLADNKIKHLQRFQKREEIIQQSLPPPSPTTILIKIAIIALIIILAIIGLATALTIRFICT